MHGLSPPNWQPNKLPLLACVYWRSGPVSRVANFTLKKKVDDAILFLNLLYNHSHYDSVVTLTAKPQLEKSHDLGYEDDLLDRTPKASQKK